MQDTPEARLARFVYERRRELGLGQSDLAARGGPSSATVRLIERGERVAMQRGTKMGLERALGWNPGTIDMIWEGTDPALAIGSFVQSSETVGAPAQDAEVLLSMPPDALDGLSPAEREEVVTAAKLSALEKAREIRRRSQG